MKTRRSDVQALRGISVLAVILFHSNSTVFPAGFLGVDIFYVISGFVVTPMILQIFTESDDIRQKLLSFCAKRAARLLPSLLFSLLMFSTLIVFLDSFLTSRESQGKG